MNQGVPLEMIGDEILGRLDNGCFKVQVTEIKMRVYTNKKVLLFIIILGLVLLSSCDSSQNDDESVPSLAEVLSITNTHREEIVKPGDEVLQALTEGRFPNRLTLENFFVENPELMSEIPVEVAAADTEDFFELLRDVYGGYVYFGGDEVFDVVRDEVIEELNDFGELSSRTFSEILHRHLAPVIEDNHFVINRQPLGRSFSTFRLLEDSNLVFARNDLGFKDSETGKLIIAIEGYDMDEIFQLHINEEGDFYYRPVVILEDQGVSSISITLIDENGNRQDIELHRQAPLIDSRWSDVPNFSWMDGLPVISIRGFGFDETPAGVGTRRFLEYAEQLKDEPVLVVDLRGNGGGNGIVPLRFFHLITGEIVPTNFFGLRVGLSDFDDMDTPEDNQFYVSREIMEAYFPFEVYREQFTVIYHKPRSIVEREEILIILVDQNTASAAEKFIDIATNVTNTLVVGTNTAGALNFDMAFPELFLPRTHIRVGFGSTIFLHPDGRLKEGRGLLPDVWADGDELRAILATILREHEYRSLE